MSAPGTAAPFVFTRDSLPRLDGSTSTAPMAQAMCAVLLGEETTLFGQEDREQLREMRTAFSRADARYQATGDREAALEMRERRARAQELLTQRNLPAELTDCLNFSDDERLEKSLNALEKAFLEQVDKAVGERMKGAAPRSGESALYAGQLRSALGLK